MSVINRHNPSWTFLLPAGSVLVLLAYALLPKMGIIVFFLGLGVVAGVISAVHHAEVIAHRVGEPFGTLVLALSVTIIEAALIISMMLSAPEEAMTLPRDTIFAAVMIILNGIIGLSLLVGGSRHLVQGFSLEGVTASLGVMTVIIVFALILPAHTTSTVKETYTDSQLMFVAVATIVLFVAFTFFQTMRHRDYFLPVGTDGALLVSEPHAAPPTNQTAFISLGCLLVSLVAVVLSAKGISPSIESLLGRYGAPVATLGIIIAAIVLMPEFFAAMRAAQANRLQTSLNLAIGSAIASIGLTIPVVVIAALLLDWDLELGLDAKSLVLLVLSLFVVSNSLRTGNTNMLPGIVHLVIFAAYLFFSFVP